jgi:sugar phosphate isomerase/epimerase
MTDQSLLGADDLVLCAGTVMSTPFLDRLAPAAAHGYRGVSMMPFDFFPLRAEGMTAAELAARVADHGLAIAELDAITTWFDGHEPPASWGDMGTALRDNTAEALCPMAGALGARSVSVVEFYGVEVDIDRATAGFAHVCDVAAEHGLLATLEFLPWTGVPTLGAGLEIVRGAGRPNGGVLVDSWHLFRSGGTLEELARVPAELIGYVQIDDAPAEAEPDPAEETQHRRLVPGEGDFDLVGLVRTLHAIGCTSPLGVEVFSDELMAEPPEEAARRCAEAMREVLRAAG